MDKKRIEIVLEALNISDDYSFLRPVEETEMFLQKSYSSILGNQALIQSLEMVGNPKRHLSQWDSILQDEVVKQKLTNQESLEVFTRIENRITRNWRIIFLIKKASNDGEIDFADKLVEQLEDGDGYTASQCNANREILRNVLNTIDLKEFKRRLKLCKPSKGPKNRIIDLKKSFVKEYASKNGFSNTFKMIQDKFFGFLYYPYALYPETKNISLIQMTELINKTPELNLSIYLKPRVLLKYAEKDINLDDEAFNLIFNEVEAIDKAYKENGNRLRDMLAFNLGCSTVNQERIKRCKKLITNPMHKRELGYHEKNVKSSK